MTNPNNYAVSLVSVALKAGGTITFGGSTCTTTDSNPVVSLHTPSNLPISIPHNSGNPVQIDLTNAVSMDITTSSSCQGATISVPITISVEK